MIYCSYSFYVDLAFIISLDMTAPLCLGQRIWRRLSCYLFFPVSRSLCIFLTSWSFPTLEISLALSYRYISLILALFIWALNIYSFSFIFFVWEQIYPLLSATFSLWYWRFFIWYLVWPLFLFLAFDKNVALAEE